MPAPPSSFQRPDRLRAVAAARRTTGGRAAQAAAERLAEAAAIAVETPVALLSLLDETRQFVVGATSRDPRVQPLPEQSAAHAICRVVVEREQPLLVEDARLEPALEAYDAIREWHMRAYLGVPVRSPDGAEIIGVLCAMQAAPRWWRPRDVRALEALAVVASDLLRTAQTPDAPASGQASADATTAAPAATAAATATAAVPSDGATTTPAAPSGANSDLPLREPLDAVALLAGGVAHDFNNLLTVISANVARLLARHPGAEATVELQEIRDAADRAAELTQQLLAVGRKQVLQPRAVELHQLLGDMLPDLRRTLPPEIRLQTRFTLDTAVVHVDPARVVQAVQSLVHNARDAMPRGGTLSLATDVVTLDAPRDAWPRPVPAGRWVRCDVRDEGVGIGAAERERVLQPFFTTKPPGEGTGLGLPAVYGIAEQSGGTFTIESAPGAGTTATLWLPLRRADHETDPIAEPVVRPPAAAGHPATILLVEDERTVRRVIERVLREAGYTVHAAVDGEEALGVARDVHPDLVVTDVVMPRMDGPTLVARLRAEWSDLRVVYMSGYTRTDIARLDSPAAGTLFLQKPFTPETLLDGVRRALDVHTPVRATPPRAFPAIPRP